MTTAEKISSDIGRLDTLIDSSWERFRAFLDQLAADLASLRRDLHDTIRSSMERTGLLQLLGDARRVGERSRAFFERALATFQGEEGGATVEAYLRAADDFLAWVRGLEARVAIPAPPFDETRLPPAPDGPTAAGYVSVREARARARSGKTP
jgi:hypothetical protein